MKRNFKHNSICEDKQISSRLFLLIIISNILWISLFCISFNKINSSNNSDVHIGSNYGNLSDYSVIENEDPGVLSFDKLSYNGGDDNMSADLIQLYSDDAKTQKAYPVVHASGVFDENGDIVCYTAVANVTKYVDMIFL